MGLCKHGRSPLLLKSSTSSPRDDAYMQVSNKQSKEQQQQQLLLLLLDLEHTSRSRIILFLKPKRTLFTSVIAPRSVMLQQICAGLRDQFLLA